MIKNLISYSAILKSNILFLITVKNYEGGGGGSSDSSQNKEITSSPNIQRKMARGQNQIRFSKVKNGNNT